MQKILLSFIPKYKNSITYTFLFAYYVICIWSMFILLEQNQICHTGKEWHRASNRGQMRESTEKPKEFTINSLQV